MSMRNARWILTICILAIPGCDWREDPEIRAERERDRAAAKLLRELTQRVVERAGGVTLTKVCPIPDGGSYVFLFKTDTGVGIDLLMLHQRKEMGGNTKYQEFRIFSSAPRAEFEVERGSSLESHVKRLLLHCTVGSVSNPLDWKPTPQTIPWLLTRIVDRSIPLDTPPVAK